MSFHDSSLETVYASVGSDKHGLPSTSAKNRLIRDGPNQLKVVKRRSTLSLLLSQFNDFLIWILFGAVIMAVSVGEHVDAAVIAIILVLNAIFGFIQEFKAEKAIEKLKQLTAPKATVIRDGKVIEIPAAELVVGDIVIISEGTKISADLRLIEEANLEIDESSLTGESNPSSKTVSVLAKKIAIADMKNMAFTGTTVTQGRGKGIVVATAMDTEIGKIAGMISETARVQTPLKVSLEKFGRQLGMAVLGICVVVFLL
jgi:Ca2+-transporting ATPase